MIATAPKARASQEAQNLGGSPYSIGHVNTTVNAAAHRKPNWRSGGTRAGSALKKSSWATIGFSNSRGYDEARPKHEAPALCAPVSIDCTAIWLVLRACLGRALPIATRDITNASWTVRLNFGTLGSGESKRPSVMTPGWSA